MHPVRLHDRHLSILNTDAKGKYARRLIVRKGTGLLIQWRIEIENIPMSIFAGSSPDNVSAAKSPETEFDKYHDYGLQ